jgi:hypothetical protein
MIWTGDHLDAVRRLQEFLVGPARVAVAERSRNPLEELLGGPSKGRRDSARPN